MGSLGEVFNANKNVQVKDLEENKKDILTTLEKAPSTIAPADIEKLKNAIVNARSHDELAEVLSASGNNSATVDKLENSG